MKTIIALCSLLALATAAPVFSAEPAAFTVSVSGQGRPMILIPGLSCPGAVWDTTIDRFEARFECHVLTLAGFAGAPPRPAGPVLAPACDALVEYIRQHDLQKPVIVGHSLGGFLALDLAAKHPELVGPLVVVDGVPFLFGMMRPGATVEQARASAAGMRQFWEAMDAAAYEQHIRSGAGTRSMVVSDDDHARIVGWSLASDRATVTQVMTEMFTTDLREELAAITTPAFVLGSVGARTSRLVSRPRSGRWGRNRRSLAAMCCSSSTASR
ncbi:MAG: alpha/beta fold hydrolase [Opitutaceae bacterium]